MFKPIKMKKKTEKYILIETDFDEKKNCWFMAVIIIILSYILLYYELQVISVVIDFGNFK